MQTFCLFSRCLQALLVDLQKQWNSPKIEVGAGASCPLLDLPGLNWCFSFAPDFSKVFGAQGSPSSGSLLNMCVLGFDLSWWLSLFICLSLTIH